MILRIFIISCLALSNFISVAQTTLLKGSVRDASTNYPVIGVNIIVEELQKGTVTDVDGKYNLSLPFGEYTLVFSSVGYETVKKQVNYNQEKITLNVVLKESVTQINEIQVTAKSEARQIREQAMPISVITMDALQGTVSDVSEVLSKTSGVKIRTAGGEGSATRISVRGLEGKRVGFFVDGTPLNDNTDFINVNDIPVDMIERVEVYKGIVPAKFGGSAIGGAVNIVLKEYPEKYVNASYTLQSFNTHKVAASINRSIPEKGYEWGVGGFYTYSDNNYIMELPLRPGQYIKRNHDAFDKKVIGSSFSSKRWWFDEFHFELAAIDTKKEIQGVEFNNVQHAANYANAFVVLNKNEKADFLTEGLDLVFEHVFAYTVYRHEDKSIYTYDFDGEIKDTMINKGGGEIGVEPNDLRLEKHSFIQKINLNYVLDNQHSINFNSVFSFVKGFPEDTLKDYSLGYKTNYESKMNSWIAGLSYEFNSRNQKFTNQLSIKYYYYDMNTTLVSIWDKKATPVQLNKNDYGVSNALRYKFNPNLLAKGSLAYDVRLPNETELLGDGYFVAPASNLEPERNTSVNIGVMFSKNNSLAGQLQLEANVFYMYLENMIRYVGGLMDSRYENFGEMRAFGVEGEIKWDATDFLYLWGNATYQDLRDAREFNAGSTVPNPTEGLRMPNKPYFFANAGIEFHKNNLLGGRGQNTRVFSDCSFVEEYLFDFEQNAELQKNRIPRSLVFNVGLEHSLRNETIFIALQANNINNAEVVSEFRRPLPGRNYGLKIRYIWK